MRSGSIERIAVVNRGDAAVRFIQAVREHNLEHRAAVHTIALYTEPDRGAVFVRAADEAVLLGPAMSTDPDTGEYQHTYVDLARLRTGLLAANADSAWVGWGFVSERAEFADLCAELGVRFIGPSAAVIRHLGDKIAAKRLAESVGIPVVPWAGPLESHEAALPLAATIGYPLLVKAAAGGGGRGIRTVASEADLPAAFRSAAAEARSAFGDPTVFIERVVGRARHLEVQVAGDDAGGAWAIGVRDCTVQRRRQKIIEESAAGHLDQRLVEELRDAARRLVVASGYTGVGTVEFLHDLDRSATYFMEVNTRLQVEHTVTEATTGVDLVKLQLDLASGGRLHGEPPGEHGSAVEARITAEDPLDGFRPSPGRVVVARGPTGPGVRTDTGIVAGDLIPPDFDPLLLKLIAWGRDRAEAVARLRRAVADTRLVLEGGASTLGFVRALLADPRFLAEEVDVRWIDDLARTPVVEDRSAVAMVLAAVELADRARSADRARLFSTAARGRPELAGAVRQRIELAHRGALYAFDVHRLGPDRYVVETTDGPVDVRLEPVDGHERFGSVGPVAIDADVLASAGGIQVDLDGSTYRFRSEQAGVVRAQSPSMVVAVRVVPGQAVRQGEVLVVLESMKLEMPVVAPADGIVREVHVLPNSQVDAGAPMLQLETAASDGERTAGSTSFGELVATTGPGLAQDALTTGIRHLSGFEPGPPGPLDELPDDPEREELLLALFADCCAVTSPVRPVGPRVGTAQISAREALFQFIRATERSRTILSPAALDDLQRVLATYGATDLEPGDDLDEALYRLVCAQLALDDEEPVVAFVLRRMLRRSPVPLEHVPPRDVLQRLADATDGLFPVASDLARAALHRFHVAPTLAGVAQSERAAVDAALRQLVDLGPADGSRRAAVIERLARSSLDVGHRVLAAELPDPRAASELLLRRLYGDLLTGDVTPLDEAGPTAVSSRWRPGGADEPVIAALDRPLPGAPLAGAVVELFVSDEAARPTPRELQALLAGSDASRVTATVWSSGGPVAESVTAEQSTGPDLGTMHPAVAERLEMWRLDLFDVTPLSSSGDVHLLATVARSNLDDRRLVVLADVRAADGDVATVVETSLLECFALLRGHLATMPDRPAFNRIVLSVDGVWDVSNEALRDLVRRLEPNARNLGLEQVAARVLVPIAGETVPRLLRLTAPSATGMAIGSSAPSPDAVRPLTREQQQRLRLRARGLRGPFELVNLLARETAYSDFPPGRFREHDLDDDGRLGPVDRPAGENTAGIVVGIIENDTAKHPQGMRRVALFSDAARGLGALAAPECQRIVAALDLAETERLPVEWFTVSSGARISMDSGTENLDAVATALRRIVLFTQAGGEINVVVCGVNVGAQPYFNAEATMLMHTRGILVMTPDGSMVLTGKDALDFAGGVSADDNVGIGGYDRVMGPNGQAQYWAPTIEAACETLFRHYDHTYVEPGEPGPRRRPTSDPIDRDISRSPHPDVAWSDFTSIGDIFSAVANPERKKPFDMRALMDAVIDDDATALERWSGMLGAESVIVWDAHLGGWPICLLGVESHPLPRTGIIPADGPDAWSAATLFPRSSKKLARAINAASGNRPVVVLANLAGFDGSPESLRKLQLEYGAEIGRAVTNFSGPLVFCVVSRYHGGAFVVFSKSLNEHLEVLAVEGARASVIGGSAAAAVVFSREVDRQVSADERIVALEESWAAADVARRLELDAERDELLARVRAEVLGRTARRFDDVHTVERAVLVGSVDRIVSAARLRPELIDAIERKARLLGQVLDVTPT